MNAYKRASKTKFYYLNDPEFKSIVTRFGSIYKYDSNKRNDLFVIIRTNYPDLDIRWAEFYNFADSLSGNFNNIDYCNQYCKNYAIFSLLGRELYTAINS